MWPMNHRSKENINEAVQAAETSRILVLRVAVMRCFGKRRIVKYYRTDNKCCNPVVVSFKSPDLASCMVVA